MMDLSSPEIRFAVDSIRQASELVQQVRAEMAQGALMKSDRSPVTVADFGAQALVACLMARSFPEDSLVAEEDAAHLRTREGRQTLERVAGFVSRFLGRVAPEAIADWIDRGSGEPAGRFWTMDPIDGTKGFLRGEQYAVALALVVEGKVQVGVLGCPNLRGAGEPDVGGPGSLVIAGRGQGAWSAPLNKKGDFVPLHVSSRQDPGEAVMINSVEKEHTDVARKGELMAVLGIKQPPLLMDSLAKYAVLAAGGADLLFRLPTPDRPDRAEYIWDQAPGVIIVEEAGGKVTDLEGKPLDFRQGRTLTRNHGVLLSNGHLHDAALKALADVYGKK
jgi:3'(2'), 5'-bisphosphate nucleotidase